MSATYALSVEQQRIYRLRQHAWRHGPMFRTEPFPKEDPVRIPVAIERQSRPDELAARRGEIPGAGDRYPARRRKRRR